MVDFWHSCFKILFRSICYRAARVFPVFFFAHSYFSTSTYIKSIWEYRYQELEEYGKNKFFCFFIRSQITNPKYWVVFVSLFSNPCWNVPSTSVWRLKKKNFYDTNFIIYNESVSMSQINERLSSFRLLIRHAF